jgi:peptidoglycan/xylan/chitin deacetylase (PgdA/CDA1 family)
MLQTLKPLKEIAELIFALMYRVYLLLFQKVPARVALYYHGLKQRDVAGFENQMGYLARRCRVVKASEIMTAPKDRTKPVVTIIFDDAFVSFQDNALPVLRRYGLTATVAVPVGILGKSPNWLMDDDCDDHDEVVLDAKAITDLDRLGYEIMSHTISHRDLTQISDTELKQELCESKRTLEQILGHEVGGVTYPYGACNAIVCETAAKAGYRLGFSVEPQTVCQSTNSLCIGRFKVSPDESMLRFKLKAQGAYRIAGFLRRLKRVLMGHRQSL